MRLLISALLLFSPAAYAGNGVSCLFGPAGSYPEDDLTAVKKEQIETIRSLVKQSQEAVYPGTKGKLLQSIPPLLPLILAANAEEDNPCHAEFVRFVSEGVFVDGPIEFSSYLFGRIHAVGDVSDYRTVMPAKAEFLMRLFMTPDASYGEWLPDGEPNGPTVYPEPSEIRLAIAEELAHSNLTLNVPGYREFLDATAAAWPEMEVRDKLFSQLGGLVDYYVNYQRNDGAAKAARLLRAWTAEVQDLLSRDTNTVWPYDWTLNVVRLLAEHSAPAGIAGDARNFLNDVVTKEGHFPMTEDVYHGPENLLLEARIALLKIGG